MRKCPLLVGQVAGQHEYLLAPRTVDGSIVPARSRSIVTRSAFGPAAYLSLIHISISRATKAGAATEVGSDCFLMAACHVAHDCRIGSNVVIANAVLLAGHVRIGERAFLGGGAVIHQFCRIGEGAMIGGGARISRDIAPFCLATERNGVIGLNAVSYTHLGLQVDQVLTIQLSPNCSLTPRGAALFFASICTVSFSIALVMAFKGLWPIFPFAGLEMLLLGLIALVIYTSFIVHSVLRGLR